jgi:hypothetical protein
MKVYDAFCWFLIIAVVAIVLILITNPEEEIYELTCRGEKAYVEYKHWSARVPNADNLCALEYKPLSLLM